MAITVKHGNGKADESPSPTGSVTFQVYGPPPSGNPFHRGIYVAQVAGASGTYRFTGEEQWTPGVASPSTWVYAS
jgi:hypothetical protein